MAKLNTSLLMYRDHDIDAKRAAQLVVYRYHLAMVGVKFWQWRECFDPQLSGHSYPYYLQGDSLYVAVIHSTDRPPTIKAVDGTLLEGERVAYAPEYNPVWLKLILRRIGHQTGKTIGYRALGKPLLTLAEWGGVNPGVEAIDLDVRVRQRRDQCTTEVYLNINNVLLRKLTPQDPRRGPLWSRAQDGWFSRWFSGHKSAQATVLYGEIKKSKHRRKLRPFLDLTSPNNLATSRSYFIQQVVANFIEAAQYYGFALHTEVLTIEPHPHHRSRKSRRFASLPLANFAVTLIDARENIEIPLSQLQAFLQPLLQQQGLDIELQLPSASANNLHDIQFLPQQRYLVILDQGKGLPEDPYLITQQKMQHQPSCAIQHLIINPYEMDDSINTELWFTRDQDDNIIEVQDAYYDYEFSQLLKCADTLAIKLAVCVKELHFKQLMRDPSTRISQYLPQHAAHLSNISLITHGCLFTVEEDRPVVIPITFSDPELLEQGNCVLARHGIDYPQLLQLLITHWPYHFGPQQDIQRNVDKFIKAQTLVMQGTQNIYLQSPQQHTPTLTPAGLASLGPLLAGRKEAYSLARWRLPGERQELPSLPALRQLLVTGDQVTDQALLKLQHHLPRLCQYWQQVTSQSAGHSKVRFDPLRKAFNELAKQSGVSDKKLLGLWWQWLSATIQIPVYDPRVWLRQVPGLTGLWFDAEQGVYLVGELGNLKLKLIRQPSIYRWHALRGELNGDTLMPLLDVDFVRMGSLAGRVYPHLFIRLFLELSDFE